MGAVCVKTPKWGDNFWHHWFQQWRWSCMQPMILQRRFLTATPIPWWQIYWNIESLLTATNLLKRLIFLHGYDIYNDICSIYVYAPVIESVSAICFVWLVVTWLPALLNLRDSCCHTCNEHWVQASESRRREISCVGLLANTKHGGHVIEYRCIHLTFRWKGCLLFPFSYISINTNICCLHK